MEAQSSSLPLTQASQTARAVTWQDLDNRHLHYMEQATTIQATIQAHHDQFSQELQKISAAVALTQQNHDNTTAANRDFYQEFKEFRSEMQGLARSFTTGKSFVPPQISATPIDSGHTQSYSRPPAIVPHDHSPLGNGQPSSSTPTIPINTDFVYFGISQPCPPTNPVFLPNQPPQYYFSKYQLPPPQPQNYPNLNFHFPPYSAQDITNPRPSTSVLDNPPRFHDTAKPLKARMDFPQFSSGDPTNWLYKAELYFRYHQTNPLDYLFLASMHLEIPAATWFQGLLRDGMCPDWATFKYAIHDRFRATDYEDPLVPVPVIGSFKKMKKLTKDLSIIEAALRTSSLIVLSSDGKKVKRSHPLPLPEIRDVETQTVLVENLPKDHSEDNIRRLFGTVGHIVAVTICDPHSEEALATLKTANLAFSSKLHALIEYDTVEAAEGAVSALNDDDNWSGMRVQLLSRRMEEKLGSGGGKGGRKRNKSRGKGHHYQSANGQGYHPKPTSGQGHGSVPSGCSAEGGVTIKPIPGPKMPDGTRGFTMGRGRPIAT